jgi:hypothetical protein
MRKSKSRDTGDTAVLDCPVARVVKQAYRVGINSRVGWLPKGIVVTDCESAEHARAELHRMLDDAITHIEPERR